MGPLSHQSAFVAAAGPRASAVSRCMHAELPQSSSTPQRRSEERSHPTGFLFQPTRDSLTKVMATVEEEEQDLKADCDVSEFSCRNAHFFATMSATAYSSKDDVKTFFQGNETMSGLGFEHFKWFEAAKEDSEKSMFDAVQDTEAFVAANNDLIMVVFRGTSELSDWATNLDVFSRRVPETWGLKGEGCDVHGGFDDGVDTVWHGDEGMYKAIKSLYEETGKTRKLYIAGHSLGGALATVAAARLAFVDDINITGMYTIGSPRVFDGQLSEHFDAKMNHGTAMKDKYFRCRNNNDIVPRMMPPPYEHVGTEIYLNRYGAIKATSFWDRLMGRYDAYMKLEFGEGINDHSSSEYIRIFKKLMTDQESA